MGVCADAGIKMLHIATAASPQALVFAWRTPPDWLLFRSSFARRIYISDTDRPYVA